MSFKNTVLYVKSKRNCEHNQKSFLCRPQKQAKTQPVLLTAIFHGRFTLCHIKLSKYRKTNLLLINSIYLVFAFLKIQGRLTQRILYLSQD